MHTKKYVFLGITAITAIAMLAGCSTNAGATGAPDTLTVSAVSGEKPGLDPAIASFEKKTGITVKVTYADNPQFQTTIRTQLSAGTGPDVFTVWPGNGNTAALEELAPGNFLTDLSDMDWNSKVPEQFTQVTEVNGKRLILPMAIGAYGVLYNEAAVKDAGTTVPTTWSEVLSFCDAAKSAGKVAFALGAQTVSAAQVIAMELAATLVYQADPNFQKDQDAGRTNFASSHWVEAFNKYLEMQKRGCFNKNPVGTSVDISNQMVASGDALAQAQHTARVPSVQTLAPKGAKFGFFALPATDNPDDTWMPAGAADGFAINSKAKNPEAAQQFIEWLASDSVRSDYATKTGALPALPVDGFQPTPAGAVLDQYFTDGRTATFMDQLWPNGKVTNELKVGVQNVLTGQASVADTMKAMDSVYK
ncbi:extracellular solute-binding protein [Microbacterium kribbense]|uniref:Extracellular solute-binding protein n=1 Tax=Microbacterium kribbense TaxID=433645 RepID=A0ABP7GS43_9MICO